MTKPLNSSSLKALLASIRHLSASGVGHAERTRNLLAAFALVVGLVRKVNRPKNKISRAVLNKEIARHYERKDLRRPRQGTNSLIPIVRLCFPKHTAGDHYRYVGFLNFCLAKKLTSEFQVKTFKKNGANTFNEAATQGRAIGNRRGWPEIDISFD